MHNISVFKNSKMRILNSEPPKTVSWIIIVILVSLISVFIGIFYQYNVYMPLYGCVENNDKYNIKTIISKDKMPLKKDYKLFIEGKKYDYEIINIEEYDNYYEIFINCKVDKNLLINNNYFTLYFMKYKTTLMNEIIKKIKRGMM